MTSTMAAADVVATPIAQVRVALFGRTLDSAGALCDRLRENQESPQEMWDLRSAAEVDDDTLVDIALCEGAAASREARAAFPGATVVALVPLRSDEQDVITVLQAGAQVCVRGDDPSLIAAHLRSVARRRGLGFPRDVR